MMLPSRHYVSEHTRFIGELLANRPDLARGQQQGRARSGLFASNSPMNRVCSDT